LVLVPPFLKGRKEGRGEGRGERGERRGEGRGGKYTEGAQVMQNFF
jgi:hypothetical protein